ncbi:Yip1 family protein [Natronobacterium texcoconense]|uniref:Yip1 domain-containing protein n=1 Tax=Natronobacterium texcoconense TaxID=1095778 RepID=A0A1H1HPD0_NATTX|nr:Yip1 family protein [Natronobacterium texcoconense]SDR27232.1 Yip1 domain-containing protein [Natronobacterium texcoconense]
MLDAARQSLPDLLVRPSAFFEENRPAETLPIAIGLVVVLAIVLVVAVFLLGSMLAGAVEGTVTVDNPDRPPEPFCNGVGAAMETVDGCDEPETIERDAGELVQDAVTDYVGYALLSPFFMWVLGGIVLFGVSRLANGDPSLSGTFALAGWAALPELVRVLVGLATLQYVLSDLTITDHENAPAVLESALAPAEPILVGATLLVTLWQWHLLTGGLEVDADLSRAAAAVATGVPLGLLLVFSL